MDKDYTMIYHGDSLDVLKTIPDESVDLLCTDPPYGYSFMGKSWDKALPDIGIFKECFRVLKPGAFAFVMSAPRSDVCSRMAILLEDAGFRIDFTPIYWTYASGFPKAMNIGKMVDKRGGKNWHEQKQVALYIRERMKETGTTTKALNVAFETVAKANHWTALDANNFCMPTLADYQKLKPILQLDGRFDALIEREEAEREVIGKDSRHADPLKTTTNLGIGFGKWDITKAATPEAKALDGSYGGFQPKPAVEVVIVAMKPLSEKTYVDQALKNGKGITWLDDCRVPHAGTDDQAAATPQGKVIRKNFAPGMGLKGEETNRPDTSGGRFPANLLVSDDVLNDGRIIKGTGAFPKKHGASGFVSPEEREQRINLNDSGSYSRYFDLDAWAKTLPFLIVPKASKREKNEGLDEFQEETVGDGRQKAIDNAFQRGKTERKNVHPTVKPLKLMSYLITLGSRPGDTVLDPFLGSGTTAIAAKYLGRECIGIEREKEYVEIAEARLNAVPDALI